jgi:F0F1-type ATP synthase assembly protein I
VAVPTGPLNPKTLAFYVAISQVGLEMVAPIVAGLVVDYYLGWSPWGVVVGAVAGPVYGFWHLVVLLNRPPDSGPRDDP